MTTRWEVERALWASDLDPPARLIVCALMSKADNDTAVVEAKHTPSLSTLTAMTGLARSAVAEWLNALEDAGWVKRLRGEAKTDRTSYALLVGTPTARRRPRKASPPSGQANDPAMTEFGSPQGGLVRQEDKPASPPHGPEVVRDTDAASPPGGHASLGVSPTEKPTPETPKSRRGTRLPDDFQPDEKMIAWARENTPNVGLRETEAFIDYWTGISGQRGVKLDWVGAWRNWMRKSQADFDRARGRSTSHRPYRNPTDESAYYGDL